MELFYASTNVTKRSGEYAANSSVGYSQASPLASPKHNSQISSSPLDSVLLGAVLTFFFAKSKTLQLSLALSLHPEQLC